MNEGTQKITRGNTPQIDASKDFSRIVEVALVVSVDDPYHMGRIKVRIKGPRSKGGDDGILDNDLPWCFPLIPKTYSVTPKPKEAVFVFIFNKDREFADRLYIGPIISQPDKFNFDSYFETALRGFSFAPITPNVSIDKIPELKGVFPDPMDVSIQGRYNTDITQKPNEIVIRTGKFEISKPNGNNPYPFKFNTKTQAYIQIKNDVTLQVKTDTSAEQKGTVTNIVSNKVNIITHENGNPRFNVTNQDNLISEEEMANILKNAHQLPFGDILLQYLILMKEALLNHVHNGSGNPATDLTTSGNKQTIAEFKAKADDLEKSMLSKNIRIN
jgi:hypothetical protein